MNEGVRWNEIKTELDISENTDLFVATISDTTGLSYS